MDFLNSLITKAKSTYQDVETFFTGKQTKPAFKFEASPETIQKIAGPQYETPKAGRYDPIGDVLKFVIQQSTRPFVSAGLTTLGVKEPQEVRTSFQELLVGKKPLAPLSKAGEQGDFVVGAGQDIIRSAVSAGLSAIGIKGTDVEQEPTSEFAKALIGEKPVGPLEQYGKQTGEAFGLSEEQAKKYGLPIGVAGFALNVVPGLPGKKQLGKALIEKFGQEVGQRLLKEGTEDIAQQALKVGTKEEALKILEQTTKQLPTYLGETDLTTKVLKRLEGKSVTSKQEILDFTNMPELKQAERDLIRRTAEDFGDQVPVKEFANKVKTELLPLKLQETPKGMKSRDVSPRYEGIVLPDELRGPVANYKENVYESPIRTSAGDVHFGSREYVTEQGVRDRGAPNYFAHTRIEDLPDMAKRKVNGRFSNYEDIPGDTRRVIELQSDLFQKGRLEDEMQKLKVQANPDYFTNRGPIEPAIRKSAQVEINTLQKLEPYRNTWHERIIREEVKQAAKDGKTKLQFPTGETAMKIEGLGERRQAFILNPENNSLSQLMRRQADYPGEVQRLSMENIKIGQQVNDGAGTDWIITDVLGDGKFKAVPKTIWDGVKNPEATYGSLSSKAIKETNQQILERATEQFDISGKVDTNNPIYRFYEKDVRKFLQNKFNAKEITDPQGVKWMEVNVSKALAKAPVEAFGAVAGVQVDEQGNVKFDPKMALLGIGGFALAKNPRLRKLAEEAMSNAEVKFAKDQELVQAFNKKFLPQKGAAKPSFWQRLKTELNPFKYQEAPVKNAWIDRTKSVAVANEKANEEFLRLSHIPENKGLGTIFDYQAGKATAYSTELKETFDSLFKEANERGFDFGYRQNYLPQIYANTKEETTVAVLRYMKDKGVPDWVVDEYVKGIPLPQEYANALKLTPTFSYTKVFPDYKTAMEYGLTPRYSHPAQLAAYYRNEMEKSLANRRFLDTLKDEKAISQFKYPGYKAVDLPFSNDEMYAKPDLAKALNKYWRDEDNLSSFEHFVKLASTANRRMQELVLSGGAPSTNINFFTIGQAIKDMTSGEFKVLGRLTWSNFDSATKGWFRANQSYITKMAEEGISVAQRTGNWDQVYKQMSSKTGVFRGFEIAGEKFDQLFNKKTFQSFMPMQTVATFKGAFDSAIGKGLSEVEARKLAGETTKAWAGLIEEWGRGQTTKEGINALLFAPRFREGLINLFKNTVLGVSSEIKNPAFARNKKFVIGMAITYAGYNMLNKQLTGNYIWENEPGKEFDLKIPLPNGKFTYIAFLPSVLAFPRNMISGGIALTKFDSEIVGQKFGSLFSMPIKLVSEIATNQDYFGRNIWEPDDTRIGKMKTIAKYIGVSQYNHPYVEGIYELVFGSQTSRQKDWYEILSHMAELPLKFNNQENIDKGTFYDALDAKQAERNKAKEPIRELYDQLQEMKANDKVDEANKIYYALPDQARKLYDDIKQAEKSKATTALKAKIYPIYLDLQEMKAEGRVDEANEIYDQLSKEEKRVYQLIKKQFVTYE